MYRMILAFALLLPGLYAAAEISPPLSDENDRSGNPTEASQELEDQANRKLLIGGAHIAAGMVTVAEITYTGLRRLSQAYALINRDAYTRRIQPWEQQLDAAKAQMAQQTADSEAINAEIKTFADHVQELAERQDVLVEEFYRQQKIVRRAQQNLRIEMSRQITPLIERRAFLKEFFGENRMLAGLSIVGVLSSGLLIAEGAQEVYEVYAEGGKLAVRPKRN